MHNNGDPSQNWRLQKKGNHEYTKKDACCTDIIFNTFKFLHKKTLVAYTQMNILPQRSIKS